MQHTSGEYDALLDQIEARLAEETDFIANIAVFSALLFDGVEAVDWTGVYFLRDDELVLGPFQGRPAPARIAVTHPTLGRAVHEGRSIVTEDMATCGFGDDDLPARSQTAVPLFYENTPIGVLVVDSPFVGRFSDDDRLGLEAAAALLIQASDMTAIVPIQPSAAKRKATQPPRNAARRERTTETPLPPPPLDAPRHAPRSGTKVANRPRPAPSRSALILRRVILFASAAVLLCIALSGAVYDATSPGDWAWHVPLRKTYSILAFAWVGFFLCVSWKIGVRRAALTVAGFSALIEIGQFFAGSHEGPWFEIFDVLCGAIGGYLGALLARAARKMRYRHAGAPQ